MLVTHGIHWLKRVDTIIVLKDGEISEFGTYKMLMNNNSDLAKLIQNYQTEHINTGRLNLLIVLNIILLLCIMVSFN